MYNIDYLSKHIAFVDFYAQVCGPACEIVLYDVSSVNNSIIAVQNAASGQKRGDPMSDIVQRIVENRLYVDRNYLINYNPNGKDRLFSAFFIKDNDNLKGVLCVSKDVSMINELETILKAILDKNNLRAAPEAVDTNAISDRNAVTSLLHNMIKSEIDQTGIHPARLTLNEKVQLVHRLNEKGTFMIVGAISEIAKQLMISEPTVYRYLNRSSN